jgi:DNA-directed RNA polymerase I subunit RPA12
MTDIEKPAFNSDVDFCPDCGSIFPLPTGASDVVKCVLCGYSVDITRMY